MSKTMIFTIKTEKEATVSKLHQLIKALDVYFATKNAFTVNKTGVKKRSQNLKEERQKKTKMNCGSKQHCLLYDDALNLISYLSHA